MIYPLKYKHCAKKDIKSIYDHIEYNLFAPITAKRFVEGMYAKIETLKYSADVFAVSTYKDVLKYDTAARHVVYKEFAVIYSIHGNLVVVHRIIHGSLIKE
jgi:plasmid stabilization system protein ParE